MCVFAEDLRFGQVRRVLGVALHKFQVVEPTGKSDRNRKSISPQGRNGKSVSPQDRNEVNLKPLIPFKLHEDLG